MKTFTVLLSALLVFGCATDKNESDSQADIPAQNQEIVTPDNSTTPAPVLPQVNADVPPLQVDIPAGPDGVVAHYICPDQCAGGTSGAAGPCPVCGKPMAHNQAFHAPANNQGTVTPPPVEPAQNALGVWHYTCPNGCEGGAGNAGPCANCGTMLAHNAAYHQ